LFLFLRKWERKIGRTFCILEFVVRAIRFFLEFFKKNSVTLDISQKVKFAKMIEDFQDIFTEKIIMELHCRRIYYKC